LCCTLGACAVIEVSTDKGCASYLVLGVGASLSGPMADAAVTVGRIKAIGVYAHQGLSTRIGVGVMEELWIAVDPKRADVVVSARRSARGADEVVIRSADLKERSHEAGSFKEVHCRFDGLVSDAERMR
jgi:hypothetical protein